MAKEQAKARADTSGRWGRGPLPWSRTLLALAVIGPALWLGGVKPWIVPCFALVVFGLLLRRLLRSREPLRTPAMWWLGLVAAGLCALQWLPMPLAVLKLIAPGLQAALDEALAGAPIEAWHRISVHPGQTGLEFARLLALTGLFVAAANLSWRLVASYVSAAATLVALIGLVQKLVGAEAIYGLYQPRQQIFGLGQQLGSPLLTSFVNPNHQSGLLLLGLFSTAAVIVDLRRRPTENIGRAATARRHDRLFLAFGVLAIQATALILSMSRAALISAAILTPVALIVSLRGGGRRGDGRERGDRRRGLILAVVVVAMLALAFTQGAWDQLATLRDTASFRDKLRVAVEGLKLIPLSPVLGTGRGSFVDLFPLVDSEPGAIVFTHLESTPIALIVEFGPVGGGLLVLGGLWWAWRSLRAATNPARRVAMCGLAALAIQSCADFSLDYLGVAAPAVALAGSLGATARSKADAPKRRSLRVEIGVAAIGLILAELVAIVSIPGSWSMRRRRDRELLAADEPRPEALRDALARTPLDPFVHLALARARAYEGDWEGALTRAEVAARLRPASLDAHLLAATAASRLDRPLDAIAHVRAGLEHLRPPVPAELVELVLAGFPEPEQIAAAAPDDPEAWSALARALADPAPAHARALAAARTRSHPEDPEPLRLQAELALARKNPGLALHHARLLVALRPDEAQAHRLRAEARLAQGERAQIEAAIAELDEARNNGRMDDRAIIDELLVLALLRLGTEESLERAELLLHDLLAHRARPQTRKRRRALADRVRAAEPRDWPDEPPKQP